MFDPSAEVRRRRRRWRLLAGVGTGVAALSLLLGFGLSRDPTVIRSQLLGQPAPGFALTPIDGGPAVDVSDLRGQVVVVNFWASWCTECRVEHPALLAAWDRYRDQGVVFLGIAFEDRLSASRDYLRSMGGDWPQLADPDARAALAFGVFGVPETFVIDRGGRVVYKSLGPITYDVLIEQIDRLLPEAR